MTFGELAGLNPSDYFYSLHDKAINYIWKKSFDAFDKADILRNDIKTKEQFLKYQKNAVKTLDEIIGKLPYDKNVSLNPKITGIIKADGFNIEKIIFQSREGVYVTCNMYMPDKFNEKIPAILMQLGHAKNGKMNPDYQKIARILVKSGFAVLLMDPAGQGERFNYKDDQTGEFLMPVPTTQHQHIGNQCFLTGDYLLKYFVCDAMRAIDYLETREEIDKDKIGATGTSGGGTMTSVLMAYDKRIKAAAPSCFLTTRREYYYAGGAQDAEQIWVNASEKNFDHYELITCFCPRPLLILSVDSDFFPLEGTDKLFKKGKEFYKLMDCEQNIRMAVDESEHTYTLKNGARAASFFSEVFFGKKTEIMPVDYGTLEEDKLWCTKTGQVITDYPDSKIIFDENIEFYKKTAIKSAENKKEFLKDKVYNKREPVNFYLKRFETPDADNLCAERFMWYSELNKPCYGVKLSLKENRGKNIPVKICLFENGTDDIYKYEKDIKKICNEGYAAFIVDLSAMGKCEPYDLNLARDKKGPSGVIKKLNDDLMFLGDSLCALRTYDLLRTIELIKDKFSTNDITLLGVGMASVYARIAEILDEDIKTEFKDEISLYDIINDKYYESYNVSGVIMPELALYLK